MSGPALLLEEAAPRHVPALAADMRPADVAECLALGGGDPAWHVAESMRLSAWAMVAMEVEHPGGEARGLPPPRPVAAWGVRREVRRDHALVGAPWCLTTSLVPAHRRYFLRCSAVMVDLMRRQYPRLENLVHARHEAAVSWLWWLGFTLDPAVPMGPAAEPFHRFWWGRDA